jgi:hypothetical protein
MAEIWMNAFLWTISHVPAHPQQLPPKLLLIERKRGFLSSGFIISLHQSQLLRNRRERLPNPFLLIYRRLETQSSLFQQRFYRI